MANGLMVRTTRVAILISLWWFRVSLWWVRATHAPLGWLIRATHAPLVGPLAMRAAVLYLRCLLLACLWRNRRLRRRWRRAHRLVSAHRAP